MKLQKILPLVLMIVLLAGCNPAPATPEAAPAAETQAPQAVEEAGEMEEPAEAPQEDAAGQALTEPTELVGIWRGRPAGGLLQIDADLNTTFAQTMDDLEGDSNIPTMYDGSIRFEGSTVFFEDDRCEAEGPGQYELFLSEDSLTFVALEDSCDNRLVNLVGQRVEPQIDITWNLVTRDIPEQQASPDLVTDLAELVGIWRGRPAGGLLQIDADFNTTFAQTMDDLEGDSNIPTMYRGTISIEGGLVYFEDDRCEAEGPGKYQLFRNDDDSIMFLAVEDACDNRLVNLVGQRVEPQIDITWNLVTTELP